MKLTLTFLLIGTITVTGFSLDVVASTSWTAAFARAAGAEDPAVLAPYDMTHPPEYELRPSDLRTITQADVVIYAGYETMVERLLEVAGNANATAVRIATVHSAEAIAASVRSIAEALGTVEAAEANLREIIGFLGSWQADIAKAGLDDLPVAVHVHQRALAEELGMSIAGVYGPAPLEARQIDELSQAEPVLIIDNGHNPVATPLLETTDAAYSVWYNFPGVNDTRTLSDVLRFNRDALERSLGL
jgi:hypothetical protein